tara:strand:+ start:2869 stop:3063 length:195 start_codon:yes stop_codon:yes gene_type:complete
MSFLNKDEVEFLTGYSRVNDQSKWLALRGIPFYVSRNGKRGMKCVVAWNALNSAERRNTNEDKL